MRHFRLRRKVDRGDPSEAIRHLESVRELDKTADEILAKEQKVVRENHIGPRIALAFREGKL